MIQRYEKYWKITLEYTNFNDAKFIGTLQIIVNFIDENKNKEYSKKFYEELQNKIYSKFPKADMGSVRKSINQCIKLGFINTKLKSYPDETIEFIEAKTNKVRRSILSKIIYEYASFNRSVKNDSEQREINFLIKTLEKVGELDTDDLATLMNISDLSKFPKGYLNKEELEENKEKIDLIDFKKRKYNQISYLKNILNKLDDLIIKKGKLYFKEDYKEIFKSDYKECRRDSYLQRIYKNQLEEEVLSKTGRIKCMLEKLSYPSLVASHIKPFIISSKKEAYDSNNGLLLSRNMDLLFDQGYISFKNNGKIILSKEISRDLKLYLKKFDLNKSFLNKKRIGYLNYHREKIYKNQ